MIVVVMNGRFRKEEKKVKYGQYKFKSSGAAVVIVREEYTIVHGNQLNSPSVLYVLSAVNLSDEQRRLLPIPSGPVEDYENKGFLCQYRFLKSQCARW